MLIKKMQIKLSKNMSIFSIIININNTSVLVLKTYSIFAFLLFPYINEALRSVSVTLLRELYISHCVVRRLIKFQYTLL